MGVASPQRTIDAVERAVRRAGTADELLEGLATEVRRAIPYDGAMWFGVDPSTLLAVAPARMEALDEGYCQPFWDGEFHEHDANLFTDLARTDVPAATLFHATDGQPLRSARYRNFIRPQGYDDELRSVFRTGDRTWGVAALMREAGRPAFDADDVALFAALSEIVGDAIRTQAARSVQPPNLSHAPGLLLFDAENTMVSANDAAARWLDEIYGIGGASWLQVLGDRSAPDLEAAIPIVPLLARARAVAAGRATGAPRLRLRDRAGRWVVLHASALAGNADAGSIAVVVEPAKSADIAPIILEAYRLTPRERDVVRAIASGSSTPQIAAELHLSAHTVRDYIKSVFEKIGVNSRAELVAKLFAEHYTDPFHETLVHLD
ncbi:MAG TPA: helix-turn-helix transcriptional regulator [Acidimicrobiia bacterium]|nr:helix-turn-helix transcriptional regulator [Acidimicrobiia bacterium]